MLFWSKSFFIFFIFFLHLFDITDHLSKSVPWSSFCKWRVFFRCVLCLSVCFREHPLFLISYLFFNILFTWLYLSWRWRLPVIPLSLSFVLDLLFKIVRDFALHLNITKHTFIVLPGLPLKCFPLELFLYLSIIVRLFVIVLG